MTEKEAKREAERLSRLMLKCFPARDARVERERPSRALKYYREMGGK